MAATAYTVFDLGGEELALRKISVLGTAKYTGKKQKLSGVDSFILGKDSDGNILIDLNEYLKFPLKKLNAILYVNVLGQKLGLVVNDKKEDLDIDNGYISQTPENLLSKYKTHFITGVAQLDDRLIILIDERMLFSEEDQKKIMAAKLMQVKGGFLGSLFGKKKSQDKESSSQDIASSSPDAASATQNDTSPQTISATSSLNIPSFQQMPYSAPSSYSGYTPYLEVISPVRLPPPYREDPVNPYVAQTVLFDLQGHVQEIDIREAIDVDDRTLEVNDSIRKLKDDVAKAPVFTTGPKQHDDVTEFLDHLKEDPFMKKQEEIQQNLKKIKDSITKLDVFFEELLTREETDHTPYDTSEEVLFSSVGIELDDEKKYRSGERKPEFKEEQKKEQQAQQNKEKGQETPPSLSSPSVDSSLNQKKQERMIYKTKSAPPEQGFKFNDGRFIHTLQEFEEELKTMNDEEFSMHVNDQKNDFADWIEHAVGIKEVAQRLRPVKSKSQASEIYERFFEGTQS